MEDDSCSNYTKQQLMMRYVIEALKSDNSISKCLLDMFLKRISSMSLRTLVTASSQLSMCVTVSPLTGKFSD